MVARSLSSWISGAGYPDVDASGVHEQLLSAADILL
jgi:hypothetical protein